MDLRKAERVDSRARRKRELSVESEAWTEVGYFLNSSAFLRVISSAYSR